MQKINETNYIPLESDLVGCIVRPNNEIKGFIGEAEISGSNCECNFIECIEKDRPGCIDCIHIGNIECDVIGCNEINVIGFGYDLNWKGYLCEKHRFIAQNRLRDPGDIITYEIDKIKNKQKQKIIEENQIWSYQKAF